MNLLVTGGAGFIGSNLIHKIIDKPEISKLVNLDCLTYAANLDNLRGVHGVYPRYVFEKVDLRDKAGVVRVVEEHDISHVIHLAAETHVDRSIIGPADFMTTNINGTFHLLEACRYHWRQDGARPSVNRFLHVSTDEVYGSLGATGSFTESSPCAPNSPYSASKAASDMLARSYHQTYGLPVLVTHCSNNHGRFQHAEKLIPVVVRCLLARRPIPVYGDGQNIRDWLGVADHCEALWLVLTQGRVGETYNIGAGTELTNLSLVELICDIVDELRPELGGRSRALVSLVPDRPGHDRRYAVDAGKIRRELGWKPNVEFESCIRETVAWYLQEACL